MPISPSQDRHFCFLGLLIHKKNVKVVKFNFGTEFVKLFTRYLPNNGAGLMLVFKPRLALFYVIALVILSFATKRLTISAQSAMAEVPPQSQSISNTELSCQPK
jgi:hypothetical protein